MFIKLISKHIKKINDNNNSNIISLEKYYIDKSVASPDEFYNSPIQGVP